MRDLLALFGHLMTILGTLLGPGGAKAVIAESLLLKHPPHYQSSAETSGQLVCRAEAAPGVLIFVSEAAPGVA